MTPAERFVDALLGGDVGRLRALRDEPGLQEVVRVALDRLDPALALSAAELAALRVVAGHPGRSAADLETLHPGFRAAAPRLLALGLVSDRRFDLPDCWTRTAAGAAVSGR